MPAPSNCRLPNCAYNAINPTENDQECIGCPKLKDAKWRIAVQTKPREMTLDEAIEILSRLARTLAPTMVASGTDAIKLGGEALKWRKHCEAVNAPAKYPPLPGQKGG